ncbi:MAG TPA: hypothetical protein VGO47_05540 [Chlamydiales bacterium]|nr:hypothetical protein [Chlamydiales bacterium]
MVDHEHKALIADVGVAYLGDIRTITAKATRYSANGTLFYMAPELRPHDEDNISRLGHAHHTRTRSTKESDVFALGVTIYEGSIYGKQYIRRCTKLLHVTDTHGNNKI